MAQVQDLTTGSGTEVELCRFYNLPTEIRDQIYENVIPFEVNFVYKSPWEFEGCYMGKYNLRRAPAALNFEFSPFPEMALNYYKQVSNRFGHEIKSSISRQRHKALRTLEDCTSQTEPWNTDFDSSKITPQLLDLISRSRFIISSFGHNTQNTLKKLDKRIKNNIHNLLITNSMISSSYPGNIYKWICSSEGQTDPTLSEFEDLIKTQLPNLQKVAVEVHQPWRGLECLRTFLDWYDSGLIQEFEVVYPRRTWTEQSAWGRIDATKSGCYELLYKYENEARPAEKRWKIEELDEDEIEERGRFEIGWDYPYARNGARTVVESQVFRLTREVLTIEDDPSNPVNLELLRSRTEEEQEFMVIEDCAIFK